MLWAAGGGGARWQVIREQLGLRVAGRVGGTGVPGSLSQVSTLGSPCLPGAHLSVESGPAGSSTYPPRI